MVITGHDHYDPLHCQHGADVKLQRHNPDDDSNTALLAVPRLDAVLLTGGRRLPAGFFTEHPRPSLQESDPERYRLEHALILAACDHQVPVLGICRGMQMLSEVIGGALVRNLTLDWPGAQEHRQEEPPDEPTHPIRIRADSTLAGIVGGGDARINSFHRQAVESPGDGLEAVAWADDGVIEAVEARGGGQFLASVQYPEALVHRDGRWTHLFAAFVGARRGSV